MFCLRLAPCGPYLHMHTIRSDLSMIVFFFCFRSFRVVISHMYVLNSTCNLVISTVIFWCSNLENGHLNPCSDSSSCYDFFTSVPIACVNLINYVLAVTVNCLHGVSPTTTTTTDRKSTRLNSSHSSQSRMPSSA